MNVSPLCKALIIDDQKPGLEDVALVADGAIVLGGDEIPLDLEFQDTYPDFPDLKASAEKRCYFCHCLRTSIIHLFGSLFEELEAELPSNPSHIVLLSGFRYIRDNHYLRIDHNPVQFNGINSLRGEMRVPDGERVDGRWRHLSLSVDVCSRRGSAAADYLRIHRRVVDTSPLSARNVNSIRRWLVECKETHQYCKDGASYSLPTRLLDVGDRPGASTVHLIVTALELPGPGPSNEARRYAALSYCRGDTSKFPALVTKKKDLAKRSQGIATARMPQTIQDAITVTRMLGLRYLWVDSLCIVQNDAEDWQKESVMMLDVYGHAYITIAAVRGPSSHSGFLYPRDDIAYLEIPFRSSRHPGLYGTYLMMPKAFHLSLSQFTRDAEESTWNVRSWTFQERFMSSNVLYFGRYVYYECQNQLNAEYTEAPLTRTFVNPSEELTGFGTKQEVYNFWQNTISLYSGRELTVEGDLLLAVSGIAHRIHRTCGGQYLAGLWRENIFLDLLWYVPGISRITSTYIAPSWSWASVHSYVEWTYLGPEDRIIEECEIVDVQTETIGKDPMGRVASGYLKLSGRMHWFPNADCDSFADILFHEDADEDGVWAQPVCAILVLCRQRNKRIVEEEQGITKEGLLLRLAGTGRPDSYVRVGSFVIRERAGENLQFFDNSTIGEAMII